LDTINTGQQAALTSTSDNTKCTCKSQYDLCNCVLLSYPISKVCKEDLYGQVVERVSTKNIAGNEFDSFKPNHKSWSLYWFFLVNIFNHRGCKRVSLPPCFIKAVLDAFPDPSGVCYTGFCRNREEFEHVPGTVTHKKFKEMCDTCDSDSDSDSDSN
jgi:hypothetical protein